MVPNYGLILTTGVDMSFVTRVVLNGRTRSKPAVANCGMKEI